MFDSFVNAVFLISIWHRTCKNLHMNLRYFSFFSVIIGILLSGHHANAQTMVDEQLKPQLERSYLQWRAAMMKKNYNVWAQYTASHRQQHVKNRVLSERRPFPAWIFQVPASPPSLTGLKALSVAAKGATATAVYFGKVDFGVGGSPTHNLLLLYFVNEGGLWKYDKAEFIRLNELKGVRQKIKAGDLSYIKQKDFQPSGVAPVQPIPVGQAKYIAKVYAFCPGREVRMKVNKISNHRFQNTKASEVVVGGGLDGLNEVQFATKSLEGSTGLEALCIRVYLMSTVEGVKPIKIYEYLVNEGGKVEPFGSKNFVIDQAVVNKLNGK